MKLDVARVLITGATGGIGAATVRELLRSGACVLMTGRNERVLNTVVRGVDPSGSSVGMIVADVSRPEDRRKIVEMARSWRGGVNVLINNAGVSAAGMFDDISADDVERAFTVNTLAPMHLCRELLPYLSQQPAAHIVNVGSVFGSIGYPGHSVYSATKFALRGFSEALRRELADTNVRVHYFAPRATRTQFNSAAVEALNAELGVMTDSPERVAASMCRLIQSGRAEAVVGWPEKLFVRINALLPSVVDRSLFGQLPAIRQRLAEQPATNVHSLSRKAS